MATKWASCGPLPSCPYGYVRINGAARNYGVCVTGDPEEDPERLSLDMAATERLRAHGPARPTAATHSSTPPCGEGVHQSREAVSGTCPACAAQTLASYPVLSEGGWYRVTKCQACLVSIARYADGAGPVTLKSQMV